MGKHQVFLDLDVMDLRVRSKDVVFKVYQDDKKFGELRISQGAIVWRGRKDKLGRRRSWAKFDKLMQAQPGRGEVRQPGSRLTVRKKKRVD
jgi:hypothetical protein